MEGNKKGNKKHFVPTPCLQRHANQGQELPLNTAAGIAGGSGSGCLMPLGDSSEDGTWTTELMSHSRLAPRSKKRFPPPPLRTRW